MAMSSSSFGEVRVTYTKLTHKYRDYPYLKYGAVYLYHTHKILAIGAIQDDLIRGQTQTTLPPQLLLALKIEE